MCLTHSLRGSNQSQDVWAYSMPSLGQICPSSRPYLCHTVPPLAGSSPLAQSIKNPAEKRETGENGVSQQVLPCKKKKKKPTSPHSKLAPSGPRWEGHLCGVQFWVVGRPVLGKTKRGLWRDPWPACQLRVSAHLQHLKYCEPLGSPIGTQKSLLWQLKKFALHFDGLPGIEIAETSALWYLNGSFKRQALFGFQISQRLLLSKRYIQRILKNIDLEAGCSGETLPQGCYNVMISISFPS